MLTLSQKRSEAGRKGGSKKVSKGFAKMDKDRIRKLASIGGKKSKRRKANG